MSVAGKVAGAVLRHLAQLQHAGEVAESGELVLLDVGGERHCHDGRHDLRGSMVKEFHVVLHHVDGGKLSSFKGLVAMVGSVTEDDLMAEEGRLAAGARTFAAATF